MRKIAFYGRARGAFTLIELLIVIAVIATLAAVGIAQFGGSTDSARSAQCMSNLRSLSAAVMNYAMTTHYYPYAGSREYSFVHGRSVRYGENKGWISWVSRNAYKPDGKGELPASSRISQCKTASFISKNKEDYTFSITNGAIWTYTGRARKSYKCPFHKDGAWSYVMNSWFGYDSSKGQSTVGITGNDGLRYYDDVSNTDKILLFAELPFSDLTGSVTMSAGDQWQTDATLQYDDGTWNGTKEVIGFNHKTKAAKNGATAHVAFADGHVAKIALPRSGVSKTVLEDLTKYLCTGKDYVWDGTKYTTISE